jgi:hypothetical protein
LARQPDVRLYRAEIGYYKALSGQMWIAGLARRFARALHVDADEHLVYDGMENHGIRVYAEALQFPELVCCLVVGIFPNESAIIRLLDLET